MSTKKKKYTATLKIDGKRFSADSRSELLEKMRKYLWKYHRDYMVRRIKKGLKASKKASSAVAGHNPSWFTNIMAGVFPPALLGTIVHDYRAMTSTERTVVKGIIRAITPPVGAEASAIGELVIQALDKAVET